MSKQISLNECRVSVGDTIYSPNGKVSILITAIGENKILGVRSSDPDIEFSRSFGSIQCWSKEDPESKEALKLRIKNLECKLRCFCHRRGFR